MNEIELLKKKLFRERMARKQAESILESKAVELFKTNESLKELNLNLEKEILKRTKSLRDNELRYRILVEQAHDIIYNIDNEGYFLFVNSIVIERFGYQESEILGRRYIEFIPDEDVQKEFEYYTKVRDEGLTSDYHEFRIQAKDGSIFWIGQNVNRITNEDGSFYYSAVARDITIRKNTEYALQKAKQELVKSEVKYRSVIENMELGIMEVDNSGNILRVYDRFLQMVGYEEEELKGKSAAKTLLVDGYEHVLAEQERNRKKGETGVYEIKIRKKDGSEIWVLISGAPFYNEHGSIIGSIGVHYDITDRKELEKDLKIARQKAVQAQQAEKAFLANMSHEIRTPLNAIIGMSHLLGDTKLDEDQKELLDALTGSTHILKSLISDILDISKIDAGTLEIQKKPFDLREKLNQLISTFQLINKEETVRYILEMDSKIDFHVSSDPQLLNQILLNLLSNAQKFTSKGEIKLSVIVEDQTEEKAMLRFAVSDTGIGVSENDMQLIFQEFKQANSEIRQKYGGTGLGLSISNQLVKLLGGQLQVSSIENEGSTFSFLLTIDKTEKIDSLRTENNYDVQIPKDQYHILVVEDNKLNIKYITALLTKWKISFDIANDGLDATKKVATTHYDLIFMDLQMPKMDGFEATQIIRERNSKNPNVPIIALTASTFLSKKRLALKAGMSDFLSKPFTPDQLLEIVKKHLNESIASSHSTVSFLFSDELDTKYLNTAYANDLAYALDMFETFMEILEEEIINLQTIIESDDRENIKKALHRIKPTFTMVGLSFISKDIERLEVNLDNKKSVDLVSWSRKLENSIQAYVPIINNEINKLKACVIN